MVGMVERRDLSQEFPMGTFKYPSDFLVCDCEEVSDLSFFGSLIRWQYGLLGFGERLDN